jgi:hypothetical protein
MNEGCLLLIESDPRPFNETFEQFVERIPHGETAVGVDLTFSARAQLTALEGGSRSCEPA